MKKIMAVMAILAVTYASFLNNSTRSPKGTSSKIIACTDYYASDTTHKKHKRRSGDSTRRDTTGPAFSAVASSAK
jgi:hypothetical protein